MHFFVLTFFFFRIYYHFNQQIPGTIHLFASKFSKASICLEVNKYFKIVSIKVVLPGFYFSIVNPIKIVLISL